MCTAARHTVGECRRDESPYCRCSCLRSAPPPWLSRLLAGIAARAALVLGKTDEAETYLKLANAIRQGFDKRFFNPAIGTYGNGSQTSNVLALYLVLQRAGRHQPRSGGAKLRAHPLRAAVGAGSALGLGVGSLRLAVTIPVGSEAGIHLPKLGRAPVVVNESGKPVWAKDIYQAGVPGLTGAKQDNNAVIFAAGSGRYVFEMQ